MISCDDDEENYMVFVTSTDAGRGGAIHNTFAVRSLLLILIHSDLPSTVPTRRFRLNRRSSPPCKLETRPLEIRGISNIPMSDLTRSPRDRWTIPFLF